MMSNKQFLKSLFKFQNRIKCLEISSYVTNYQNETVQTIAILENIIVIPCFVRK